ncbi:hypothetical protein [Parathermosynechococcus lividus]
MGFGDSHNVERCEKRNILKQEQGRMMAAKGINLSSQRKAKAVAIYAATFVSGGKS